MDVIWDEFVAAVLAAEELNELEYWGYFESVKWDFYRDVADLKEQYFEGVFGTVAQKCEKCATEVTGAV